ncbi:MAG TPA: hypothetical protein VMM13_12895, partial [Euzebya sp.]|nr:hypothetical protein [Euzebya sp.]
RTAQLRDAAVAAEGLGYDHLLQEFEAEPYGEDRVAADAESRSCWAARSTLPDVGSAIDRHLAAVEEALEP